MAIPYFLGGAVFGFALMMVVGVQALVAVFSSVPLAKRRKKEHPGFDLRRALRRITRIAVTAAAVLIIVTAGMIHFTDFAAAVGYLFGMILAFVLSIRRMTPNNAQNQAGFMRRYADCFPADCRPDETGKQS